MGREGEMSRRQFIEGMAVGLAALGLTSCGVAVQPGPAAAMAATTGSAASGAGSAGATAGPDAVVIASGTDPAAMLEKGLSELGGISRYVAQGDVVLIKPNYSVPRTPDEAATTNPALVAAVVKQCLAAGAKEVNVVDFPFSGPTCLNTSGILEAVEAAGGKAFNINQEDFFVETEIGGETLKTAKVAKDWVNANVLINMPILKNHAMTRVTMSLKNMMGLVWDRGFFHRTDLDVCISELTKFRKPNLIILDALKGIVDHGPTGPGTIKEWNQIVIGSDPVAVDACGAKIFGVEASEVSHLMKAAEMGLGELDLEKVDIRNVTA